MLHPTTQAIAETFGYVPFSEEDAPEQFQADITYTLGETKRSPRSGDVRVDKHNNDEKDLEGWYEIPSNEDIEEWAFDSVCFTPGDDEVEPDHPDSWLRLLGLI
ncbi:MAG: hypothetical protein ACYTE5_10810 [Planctomycetota bacterium]|jgi:hypothetical protein